MKDGIKLVANNKKAYHDYFIEEAYECGIETLPPSAGLVQRFPVKYYLTAMLFIIFDIEIFPDILYLFFNLRHFPFDNVLRVFIQSR